MDSSLVGNREESMHPAMELKSKALQKLESPIWRDLTQARCSVAPRVGSQSEKDEPELR